MAEKSVVRTERERTNFAFLESYFSSFMALGRRPRYSQDLLGVFRIAADGSCQPDPVLEK